MISTLRRSDREKHIVENSKKTIKDNLNDGLLKKDIVTAVNIWTSEFPEYIHEKGYYMFKADEIISFYMEMSSSLGHTITGYIDKLRRERVNSYKDIKYPKSLGYGKISSNALLFMLECKCLIIENKFKSLEEKMNAEFLKKKTFYKPNCSLDRYGITNYKCLTFNELVYNVYLLQNYWNEWDMSIDESMDLINYTQFQIAKLVVLQCDNLDILNGNLDTEISTIPKDVEDESKGVLYRLSLRQINDFSCIFLDILKSFYKWNEIFNSKEFVVHSWTESLFNNEEADTRDTEWFSSLPKDFIEWFEGESKLIADYTFLNNLTQYSMQTDLKPGEHLIFLSRNNNVEVKDISRVYAITRYTMETNWWNRESLENGKLYIDFSLLKLSGRNVIYNCALLMTFDTYMMSKFKFPWLENCFFDEDRFHDLYDFIISSTMPSIIKIRNSYFVYYERQFFYTYTLDRSIYYWVYILKCFHKYKFSTIDKKYSFRDLNLVWIKWTSSKKFKKNDATTTIMPPNASRIKLDNNQNIIVNEDSLFTVFEMDENVDDEQQIEKEEEKEFDVFD
jgi:hypothetical protein